ALSLDSSQMRQTSLRLARALATGSQLEEAAQQRAIAEREAGRLTPTDELVLLEVQGSLAVHKGDLALAEQSFETEAAKAHDLALPLVEAGARLNALRTRIDREDIAGLEERLETLAALIATLPDGQDRALLEISVGELFARAVREFRSDASLRSR